MSTFWGVAGALAFFALICLLCALAMGLARMAARDQVRPAPPTPEYEATADRWRTNDRPARVEEWPYDREVDEELHHAEAWLDAWVSEQRRGGAA